MEKQEKSLNMEGERPPSHEQKPLFGDGFQNESRLPWSSLDEELRRAVGLPSKEETA